MDGFPAFIKTQWSKCALDLLNLVTTSFSEGSVFDNLNSTLITLVPKIESPESMVHFRLISLCSTLYKGPSGSLETHFT